MIILSPVEFRLTGEICRIRIEWMCIVSNTLNEVGSPFPAVGAA